MEENMGDLYFEKELVRREKQKINERLDSEAFYLPAKDEMTPIVEYVYQYFDDILYDYYTKRFGNSKTYDEIYEMIGDFKAKLTNNKIIEAYNNHKFTQEERDFIKMTGISNTWRGIHDFRIRTTHATIDVLLRNIIIEEFGESELTIFREVMQDKSYETEKYRDTINHYLQLFSDKPFGENLSEEIEKNIETMGIYAANQKINCGGYALRIDTCVYPKYQENFSQSVSSILRRFPFVRLLGNKPLEDDEYLVFYRLREGENAGHHFVRVDSDSIVREKDGNSQPKTFENWGNLESCDEVVFAVKKEHQMFGYNSHDVNYDNQKDFDFEQSTINSIKERCNSFDYHNHVFRLKKSKDDEIFIVSEDGVIVADVVADDSECLVEVREEQRKYVENTSTFVKPIIKDGKLVNFAQFKKSRINDVELS